MSRRKPSIRDVRDFMAELDARRTCDACRRRLLPGQRTVKVGVRTYHKACATYVGR